MADQKRRITIRAGDRIDLLALRAYGVPSKYALLLNANPELDVWDPQPGMIIEVPDA